MLKLAKLPDRTPAKITITVSAELNQALHRYAALYRDTYGEAESVTELIPFMLDAFLDSDRDFAKASREGLPETMPEKPARRARAPKTANTETTSQTEEA
ncbi:hypothetical protein GALL_173590 [mine drainage metagenome]|uniref:DUF2274 domain-containing protein n=1 Tax=mine drainage metagenome TaxID=410659 RepID=A0A1J5SK58_9ZZZZ